MRITKPLLEFLCCTLFLAPICIASDAYLPLEGGNEWTYSVTHSSYGELNDETLSIHPSVAKTNPPRYQIDSILGYERWVVTPNPGSRGHGKKYYVAGDGTSRGYGRLLYDFTRSVGSRWTIRMTGSYGYYEVIQHMRSAEVGGHVFQNVIQIRFKLFNSLVEQRVDQWFALGMGMVRQEVYNGGTQQTTEYLLKKAVLSGKVAFDANAGSGSGAGLRTSLSLDRFHYQLDNMPPTIEKTYLTMKLAIANGTGASVPVTYYGGQRYDIVIKNTQGQEIWRWSDGKFFTANITTGEVKDGESLDFEETVCLDDALAGQSPGTYIVEVIHVGSLYASVSQSIQVSILH
ncbi:MAG: BsuPI-related putative proteinase inhibitor [Planctomycetota bacterium]|jgi:hypothetical protein|nr:BsuPI-related putative proteinase inhibitor [Planctomycetota bacterium]